MKFKITPQGQQYLNEALLKSNDRAAIGIRIGVKKAGCSGYEYVLEYIYPEDLKNIDESLDFIFEYDNAKVVVDKEIYNKYFKGGTTIDYRQEGLNEGFKFDNPNVSSECGCGESFNLVSDE